MKLPFVIIKRTDYEAQQVASAVEVKRHKDRADKLLEACKQALWRVRMGARSVDQVVADRVLTAAVNHEQGARS